MLTERENPFSILTKSTLALRDLDLFVEAARRTEVHVDFSIGTLDPAVWKATEPGAPHPARRMEAVARLNQAGVSSGVLIAPVIPDISDGPGQVEAVRKAAEEAGARHASTITLHLRPGVREHYLAWLSANRPDLVDEYRRVYRGRSHLDRPRRRGPSPAPVVPAPDEPRQLSLGL